MVARGLPPWPQKTPGPKEVESPVLAYLIQVAFKSKLPLVARAFNHIYSPQDVFLYLVDEKLLDPDTVVKALPSPLPRNVAVQKSRHAGYFYWPRVQVVLEGLVKLLQKPWDFAIHLSESDYPVHPTAWLRKTLGKQRQNNFIDLLPRCEKDAWGRSVSNWYWWGQHGAVTSCEDKFEPKEVQRPPFPMDELERHGVRFGHSPEWLILTRELVDYATRPSLMHFRRLVGMHSAADEIFWATLVLNIPGFTQKLGGQTWFIHWNPHAKGHSPETLTLHHWPEVLRDRERYAFIRKVDETLSDKLLSNLDNLISIADEVIPGPLTIGWPWNKTAVAC